MTNEDKQWIAAQFQATNERIDSAKATLRQEFREDLEAMETKLLTELQLWAEPQAARLHSFRDELYAQGRELATLKERLDRLEGRRGPKGS